MVAEWGAPGGLPAVEKALRICAAEKEMGTTRVPISEIHWLLNLGSNQGPTD